MNQLLFLKTKEPHEVLNQSMHHKQHKFKACEEKLGMTIVASNHCNHCGAHIFQNAFKCTRKINKSDVFH